ncbi:DUF58 domain-containing protein [Mycolicibacterium duvalii]|uniref:DUF58 domain-containing protein n=1 Tax=Mycolicibacterium duvalii TaxID=39688 RepID=A0A7I7K5B9_9MYCO|nr:DUF58 domain-containing protein [Mycolicibacterium duvalii]MCV7368845.1 DUF58 domain-containing protein [Mycolicibacterium duvalii]PEG44348.1 DUF58 domain-containing protein [Mycolicibacterium duvalii]BBX19257.1 hypothetical protein MDUV_41170 [Mycolicibacterium duvalii]
MNPDHAVIADLQWRASALTRTLAACAGVALVGALVAGRWDLVVFAAPLLGVLCSLSWQRHLPTVRVHADPSLQRCFEGDAVRVALTADADDGSAVQVRFSTLPDADLEVCDDGTPATVSVSAARWGRYPVRVEVGVSARGGLLRGTGVVDAAQVFVFPVAFAQSTPIPRSELLDRLGTHLTRHIGPGVEYADIRPYVPGDQLRTVNWPVSARRGALHVTERLTDRAADVVVLFDVYRQPPGPATLATERAARGAAQVVQSALRYGDRAGLVALGGRQTRWLGADIGQRQFYRILDTMLGAADTFETASGTLAPRPAVPAGAIVVAFSTMLDTEFALALIDLRKRGHAVIAVDIMQGCPIPDVDDPLVERMWGLQRSFMYRDMATVGVDIVAWPESATLDQAMTLMPNQRGARS